MKLIGDIGGTKVLLALVDASGAFRQRCRLASAEFANFDALLAAYLHDVEVTIEGGCLAVAGPVADDGRSAKITNLPWRIDCTALEARFRLGRLWLINDFAAVAHGITQLMPEQTIRLQPGEPGAQGVRLVLGAGTGLGMAIIDGQRVLASEGGHVGFAPQDELQWRIWQALHAEYGRVTAERVISGPGLANIHRILADESLDPADIVARSRQNDAVARRTLEVFFSAYGAFAGDMALATLARGGVFLAGGVTVHLLSELPASGFLSAFNAKAEHAELVRRMPVSAVIDPEIGLRGAAAALTHSAFS
ncbi:MAG: glucokinase [Rhodocyclaceae bacterium]|jgi:glucokinase|nr:glucokinase [Rhodocyclaceae bacterium]